MDTVNKSHVDDLAAKAIAKREMEKAAQAASLKETGDKVAQDHLPQVSTNTEAPSTLSQHLKNTQTPPMPADIQRELKKPATGTPSGATAVATEDDDIIPPPPSVEEVRAQRANVVEDDGFTMITDTRSASTDIDADEDFAMILTNVATEKTTHMSDDAVTDFLSSVVPEISEYRKQIMIEFGFTAAEATAAAKRRMSTKAADADSAYAAEHPDAVIIQIDKSQSEEVTFTADEEKKIQRARALKLVEVESAELSTIKVKARNGNYKMSRIRDICGSISQYSIPLLSYGDYVTFHGAQSGVLAGCVSLETDTIVDVLDKKATLLYQYFAGGQNLAKKVIDETTKQERDITYDEFCNQYHYEDVDLGMYGIVTASSMEVTDTLFPCRNERCQKQFQISYNQKSILDLSGIPEEFKERVHVLEKTRSKMVGMAELHEAYTMSTRVKSPISQNIYEFYTPTIAEARLVLESCSDQITNQTAFNLVLALYLSKIWVYDNEDGEYIEIDVLEDLKNAWELICHIHQADLEILLKYIGDHRYTPAFKIKTKCPHCGREGVDVLSVDDMVFLHARALLTEIL